VHDQVHLSQEEDILYQSVYEKTRQKRENGGREREEHTSPQTQKKDPKKSSKICKNFCAKGDNGNRNQKCPFERNPSEECCKQEKRHKGTPKELAPPKKRRPKRNTPNKVLDGSELKKVKILTQPATVTLITDFFSALEKSQGCVKMNIAPDPT